MDWYELNLAARSNPDLAFFHRPFPEEVKPWRYKLVFGKGRISGHLTEEPIVYMEPGEPGKVLADVVGNTHSVLMVSKRYQEVMAGLKMGEIEFQQVCIYNHKRRLVSKDYYLVNPLESWDVLDHESSEIRYYNDKVLAIDRLIFDARKAVAAPDLFRLKEAPNRYFASSTLMYYLSQLQPPMTNTFIFDVKSIHKDEAQKIIRKT
ncbi:hypothetical protein EUZ85_02260 [Hahella sp. KA22]|uniref:imm11 family protein n=1 Tax=Hahella sp. KA22 TaxID=1628392 RepID=UPI000FDEE39C|nr:DUF1629 domain-containing protein [Hahella sp. KA22]AZZ95317.1 hypothetical protein ENC22_30550 [Hahella sp. KA22]QAY52962.1 hypothetical protein EUZ85_02260 [Hahella sp. KA22]